MGDLTCSNCDTEIDPLERLQANCTSASCVAATFDSHIICADCYVLTSLPSSNSPSASITTSKSHGRNNTKPDKQTHTFTIIPPSNPATTPESYWGSLVTEDFKPSARLERLCEAITSYMGTRPTVDGTTPLNLSGAPGMAHFNASAYFEILKVVNGPVDEGVFETLQGVAEHIQEHNEDDPISLAGLLARMFQAFRYECLLLPSALVLPIQSSASSNTGADPWDETNQSKKKRRKKGKGKGKGKGKNEPELLEEKETELETDLYATGEPVLTARGFTDFMLYSLITKPKDTLLFFNAMLSNMDAAVKAEPYKYTKPFKHMTIPESSCPFNNTKATKMILERRQTELDLMRYLVATRQNITALMTAKTQKVRREFEAEMEMEMEMQMQMQMQAQDPREQLAQTMRNLEMRMEENHFVNIMRKQANFNATGGWKINKYTGEEEYHEGYI